MGIDLRSSQWNGFDMKFFIRLMLLAPAAGLIPAPSAMAGSSSSKIERALSAATEVARSCKLDVDLTEVSIAIVGGDYRILFQQPRVRGGGAMVMVDRVSAAVRRFECLQ